MARRIGKLNRYKSRIRRCALSGLRGYETDMVHSCGRWYFPEWVDRTVRNQRGKALRNR